MLQRELRVEDLAEIFNVSPLTIRRDLDELAADKTIIRTFGGCLSVGRAALETEYHQKVATNFGMKRAIAFEAARLVGPGETILLNDGSTTYHVGMQVGMSGGCTIYTNSLAMISEFSRFQNVRLLLLSGEYDENRYSIGGSLTERLLETLRFDKVFLGTDAIDVRGRCLVHTPEESRLAQVMLRTGDVKILVADHTKVGAKGHAVFADLREFDVWITSNGLSSDQREALNHQTRIVTANESDDALDDPTTDLREVTVEK